MLLNSSVRYRIGSVSNFVSFLVTFAHSILKENMWYAFTMQFHSTKYCASHRFLHSKNVLLVQFSYIRIMYRTGINTTSLVGDAFLCFCCFCTGPALLVMADVAIAASHRLYNICSARVIYKHLFTLDWRAFIALNFSRTISFLFFQCMLAMWQNKTTAAYARFASQNIARMRQNQIKELNIAEKSTN